MYYTRKEKGFPFFTLCLVAAGVYLAASPRGRQAVFQAVRQGSSYISDLCYSMTNRGQENSYDDGLTVSASTGKNEIDKYITLHEDEELFEDLPSSLHTMHVDQDEP